MTSRRDLAARLGAVVLTAVATAAVTTVAVRPHTTLTLKTSASASAAGGHWVGTWAAAPQLTEASNMPPAPFSQTNLTFADSTIRQSIHVTAGGKEIRLRFSNAYGTTDLPITRVSVALPAGGKAGVSAIVPGTSKAVTFDGSPSTDIPDGADALSDPLDFPVAANTNLTVTMYLASGQASSSITSHPGSRTDTFMVTGDHTDDTDLSGAADVQHWYFLSGLETVEPEGTSAIDVIGDSLTDGRGSTTDGDDKWTDQLFNRLQSNPGTRNLTVLNQGLGGNRVLNDSLGPNVLARLDRDGLSQSGTRWLIVWEGVNDIGTADATQAAQSKVASDLIAAYQQIIDRAHAQGIKVYGATITPFGGNTSYDDPNGYREAARQEVNNWIRTSRKFDAVLDFDKAVRDPSNPRDINPSYDVGDHLHLTPQGYGVIAGSVPASLFR